MVAPVSRPSPTAIAISHGRTASRSTPWRFHFPKGWRLSPLYDVVPKPQVGLERRQVLGVGDAGRLATPANALTRAAQFDLDADEARDLVLRMANRVHENWATCFADAGIGAADRGRFATCFRQAELAIAIR